MVNVRGVEQRRKCGMEKRDVGWIVLREGNECRLIWKKMME
jgi:hypothetical protein